MITTAIYLRTTYTQTPNATAQINPNKETPNNVVWING
jgi:hypothetical protein